MNEFRRYFRVWEYRVSHDQLLLRSPKSVANSTNLDIAFVGVEYVEIPTAMKELTIVEAGIHEHQKASEILGKAVPIHQVFAIVCGDHRYIVVAAAMKVSENDLGMFESSLESF